MKKTYINPATSIISVHAVKMFATSGRLGIGDDGSADVAEGRRRRNVWDYDDDYDDEE